jgi:hypothetical protein
MRVGAKVMKETDQEITSLNHNLSGIIDRYRDAQGNVSYFALLADKAFVDYAERLSDFDLGTLKTREAKLAFWINCYNSLSIYGVVQKLKKDPSFAEKGNKSYLGRVRFFAFQKFRVGKEEYTLRSIENYIRGEYQDPRVHFALNCSSRGCPLLKDGLYSEQNIDKELDAATKLYLSSPEGLKLDKESDILFISMIFKWYKNDFEKTGRTVTQFIYHYASESIQKYMDERGNNLNLKYIDYDWGLNLSKQEEH